MRHKALLLFLVSLSRFSMATESSAEFVFNESHFREIRGIAISGIAPNGRLVDTRPVPIIFAERHGITQEQLAEAIVAFAKEKADTGQYALAAKALGVLSQSPEKNSIPYLVDYSLNETHKEGRGQVLYALLYKAPEHFASVLQQLVRDDVLDEDERYRAYRLIIIFCDNTCQGFTKAPPESVHLLLCTLRELAAVEKSDHPRWWIDHTLCPPNHPSIPMDRLLSPKDRNNF